MIIWIKMFSLKCMLLNIISYFLFSSSSLKVEYDKLANEKTEMQRHYVMVRAAMVKLWIWFNATSSLLPQVNSHRWCSSAVWYCWPRPVFSLDEKVQGRGVWRGSLNSNVQLLIMGCDDHPLWLWGPLYYPSPPLPTHPTWPTRG